MMCTTCFARERCAAARSSRRARPGPRPGARRRSRPPPPARAAARRRGSRRRRRRRPAAASTRCPAFSCRQSRIAVLASGGAPRRGCAARRHQRARRAEAADAALALRQLVDLDELDAGDRQRRRAARSASPGSTTNGSLAVGVEQHDPELAAVAGVDEPGRVDDRDPVPRREPRARLDEAGVALRDRDREAGADDRALARAELDALARGEIEPGVARVGALGQRPRRRAGAGSAARSRARAGRGSSVPRRRGTARSARSSRRGRRATTSTPSLVSSRSSIGAPSA